MSLMISARFRAAKHLLTGWRLFSRDHRIWRVYSHFGFRTRGVVCLCGEVFGDDGTAGDLPAAMMRLRAFEAVRRSGQKWDRLTPAQRNDIS